MVNPSFCYFVRFEQQRWFQKPIPRERLYLGFALKTWNCDDDFLTAIKQMFKIYDPTMEVDDRETYCRVPPQWQGTNACWLTVNPRDAYLIYPIMECLRPFTPLGDCVSVVTATASHPNISNMIII